MDNIRADLKNELKKLNSLFDAKKYSLAIDRLNELLIIYREKEEVAWILRERASYYHLLLEDDKALKDTMYILDNLVPIIVDYFDAGYTLVKQRKYEYALIYLDQGIKLSYDENNMYFIDTLLFLKAFALIKTQLYDEAKVILENMDDSNECWIDRCKPYAKEELLFMIKNKK